MKYKSIENLASSTQALRKITGWSQTELARRSGIHRNYIRSIERGERNVGLMQLERLANIFGLEAYELIVSPGRDLQEPRGLRGDSDEGVKESWGVYVC